MYGIKDNADLKAYSVPAHVNPGLENCINKLITQYFCTCVIPFVMLKCTAGGGCWDGCRESRCVVGQSRERWILQGISLSYCVYASARVCVCVCARVHVPMSNFNVIVFVIFPRSVARGVLIPPYLSRDHHCFSFPGDTELL